MIMKQLAIYKVNYGSKLFFKDEDKVKKEKLQNRIIRTSCCRDNDIANYVDLMEGVCCEP